MLSFKCKNNTISLFDSLDSKLLQTREKNYGNKQNKINNTLTMVFTFDPFNVHNTNIRDRTFDNEI